MTKKLRLKTLMESKHVKGSERLLKSARQCFFQTFWLLWNEISSNNFFLVKSKILRLFLNILTPIWQIFSLSKSECLTQPTQIQLAPNHKNISDFFLSISEIHIKFGILWIKRWASEVICFCNFKVQKVNLFKWRKSPVSEHLWTFKMLKTPEKLLKSPRQYFCHIFWSLWNETSSDNSVLLLSEILRLFVDILTPGDKSSLSQ